MNLISNDSIKIDLFELSLLYQRNLFGIEHETKEYEEFISKPIYKLVDIEHMKPVFLGIKTAEESNISEKNFEELFKSKEYKNGCVVSNWTTEEMLEIYKNIRAKSEHLIQLIDIELEKQRKHNTV